MQIRVMTEEGKYVLSHVDEVSPVLLKPYPRLELSA